VHKSNHKPLKATQRRMEYVSPSVDTKILLAFFVTMMVMLTTPYAFADVARFHTAVPSSETTAEQSTLERASTPDNATLRGAASAAFTLQTRDFQNEGDFLKNTNQPEEFGDDCSSMSEHSRMTRCSGREIVGLKPARETSGRSDAGLSEVEMAKFDLSRFLHPFQQATLTCPAKVYQPALEILALDDRFVA
jgi:hypothetical protein